MVPPDILYKYVPAKRIDILVHKRIRFSSLDDLNDPLECRPFVSANPISTMNRALAELGDEDLAAKKVVMFQEFVRKHAPDHVRNEIAEKYGILSLTTDPLHPVMWGQYADSYRGFVIGFDPSHDWFYGLTPDGIREYSLFPVGYARDRPSIEIGERLDVDHDEFMTGTILTKGKAWAFEKEWRVLNLRAEALSSGWCRGVTDLHEIPENVIVEVVLGPLIKAKTEKKIRSLLNRDFPRAKLRRLILPQTSYLLEIE